MKLQNYFQDPSSLHIGTEPLRAYYVPCREEAEANGADMLKASRAIILNGDDWKFKFYESYHQVPEGCTEKAADTTGYDTHLFVWSVNILVVWRVFRCFNEFSLAFQ